MILGMVRLIVFLLDTALWIPVALVASLADPDAKLAYRVARRWASFNVKLLGTRVLVRGLEHLDPAKSYVFMSNHRSSLDVLALVVALWDFQLRWVAKLELVSIPLFGWAVKATKQIIVNRTHHAQAVASLMRAKERIDTGSRSSSSRRELAHGARCCPSRREGSYSRSRPGRRSCRSASRARRRFSPVTAGSSGAGGTCRSTSARRFPPQSSPSPIGTRCSRRSSERSPSARREPPDRVPWERTPPLPGSLWPGCDGGVPYRSGYPLSSALYQFREPVFQPKPPFTPPLVHDVPRTLPPRLSVVLTDGTRDGYHARTLR